MRSIRHLTPRYIYNRIRYKLYEHRNPDAPWINPDAIELLKTLLRKTDRGIEWGSGRSTVWFSRRIAHLTSVENDSTWHAQVTTELQSSGVKNVTYLFRPDVAREAESEYVRVVDQIEDGSLGFALIDGQLREHCALAVVQKIAPGGILMWDNANWYVDWPTKTPASRYRKGTLNPLVEEFLRRVAGWRFIWTSGGTSDAAFWIRTVDAGSGRDASPHQGRND